MNLTRIISIYGILTFFFACPVLSQTMATDNASSIESSYQICRIPLQIQYLDPHTTKGGIRRTPPFIPEIYITNNVLYFDRNEFCEFQLIEKNNDDDYERILFHFSLSEQDNSLVIPNCFYGEFDFRFINTNQSIAYFGSIKL